MLRRKPEQRSCRFPAGEGGSVKSLQDRHDVDAVEVVGRLAEAIAHHLLTRAERHARVVVLLVRLGLALGVADLGLQVVVVLGLVLADTVPEGPLRVGVDVHLDHASLDRGLDVLEVGAAAAVEDEGDRLGALRKAELLAHVRLRPAEDGRVELDVARRVDAVDVAEGGGDGEARVRHLGERLVHLPDLLRLGVEVLGVDVLVVDAVLLATRDAQLHLQKHAHLTHALEVLLANLDVLVKRLLGEVDHVRREERLAVHLEVALGGDEHAVEPRQQVLRAVVRVQNHRHAVLLGHSAHVVGARDGAGDGRAVVGVVESFASVELRAAGRELDDHGRVVLASSLEAGIDR
mmetsp:Transcript_2361/g.4505  ORF Transcript_2361/g.4505 Transcript_2361/m.4505 type:complete len:348 (+) Transcript_2361:218-1261(+)